MNKGSKEFIELLNAFERTVGAFPMIRVGSLTREKMDVRHAYYQDGKTNEAFICFMHGAAYKKADMCDVVRERDDLLAEIEQLKALLKAVLQRVGATEEFGVVGDAQFFLENLNNFDAMRFELDALKAKVAELEKDREWLPIDENTPKDQEIMLNNETSVFIGEWCIDGWIDSVSQFELYDVTHWKPLPKTHLELKGGVA